MRQVTISEFLDQYEKEEVFEVVYIKDKVYGRSVRGVEIPEIIWASVP